MSRNTRSAVELQKKEKTFKFAVNKSNLTSSITKVKSLDFSTKNATVKSKKS